MTIASSMSIRMKIGWRMEVSAIRLPRSFGSVGVVIGSSFHLWPWDEVFSVFENPVGRSISHTTGRLLHLRIRIRYELVNQLISYLQKWIGSPWSPDRPLQQYKVHVNSK